MSIELNGPSAGSSSSISNNCVESFSAVRSPQVASKSELFQIRSRSFKTATRTRFRLDPTFINYYHYCYNYYYYHLLCRIIIHIYESYFKLTSNLNTLYTTRNDSPRKQDRFCRTFVVKSLPILALLVALNYFNNNARPVETTESVQKKFNQSSTISGDEHFTFAHNGSFLQLDAGREWPFNSKREISFIFKTRSSHGLLIYQTFDHSKVTRDEDQEGPELIPPISASPPPVPMKTGQTPSMAPSDLNRPTNRHQSTGGNPIKRLSRITSSASTADGLGKIGRNPRSAPMEQPVNIRHLNRNNRDSAAADAPLAKLANNNAITATASERLANSLFFSSPAAAINGNHQPPPPPRSPLSAKQINSRDGSLLTSAGPSGLVPSKDSNTALRNHRVLNSMGLDTDPTKVRLTYGGRPIMDTANDGAKIFSSSAINSFSVSLYELYLKLENGRLKLMYEYGSRLNQTYCGKGLNDDRWHRVDLRVDPELNRMELVLDQTIQVEIVLSQQVLEDDGVRRNDLVFTNSILYLGGLDNGTSIVKNVKQRLYMAQFIGCMGQIMLKTDQHTESTLTLQPAPIDRMVLVKRGCMNRCDADNFCLHKSSCVNYYTHTKCDCYGTNYEDVYCWRDQLTSLSMLGYSTLVYRIYDWRDRHHSSINRLSMQFKTFALDSILFYGYGDMSVSQNLKTPINTFQAPSSTLIQIQSPFSMSSSIISNLTIHRPVSQQPQIYSNHLAVSLSNGTIVVEVNFGDQPIILSNLLYDKVYNRSAQIGSSENPTSNYYRPLSLSDGRWHNVTFIHNNKQLSLYVDNYSVNYTILGKNSHLYFDPSIYFGAVPNQLLNETRTLVKPFSLRHKFVGCLRSVYFNQHNILLSLKQSSPMVEYRDPLGEPRLDTCLVQEPSSLPLTMKSGKSYLTFQLTPNSHMAVANTLKSQSIQNSEIGQRVSDQKGGVTDARYLNVTGPLKKLTIIEFEYKTSLQSYFLAGGHLRDLSYHDLGGFWTLHAKEECQLYFTISSGLTVEPEQVIKLQSKNTSCDPRSWYKISISMISGDKALNVTRFKMNSVFRFEDEYSTANQNIEDIEYRSYELKSSVELLHQVQIGGDLAKFGESSSVPFTGCIRRIKINGHLFDSRDFVTNSASLSSLASTNQLNNTMAPSGTTQSDMISSRMAQGYITLNSCQLVNPCASLNPCKNNGTCKINELGEPDCDCSKTGYTGKRCHFSIYKQSCQDLFLSGQRKSSYYVIDLDRNGPLKPIRVRCNMDEGSGHIETILAHNLPAEYLIRSSTTRDIFLDITYMAFHYMYTAEGFYVHDDNDNYARFNQDLMLRSLIGQSLYCRQHIRYECKSAPLELGNRTWMEAPYPKTHSLTSLDGVNHGKCMCATTEKKCLDPRRNCNCDSGESIWTDDSYDLIGHEDVGLTRIVILKQSDQIRNSDIKDQFAINSESQSRFTLSDLKCYGTKKHESEHEITFKTSDAYIEVPGWRRGDISFSFRTASNPPAIILYQLATSRNHGYFRLTLISDQRMMFEFVVNRKPKKLFLTSTHKLNNGEWQQVFIEYDSVNLRLTINDDSALVDLEINDSLGTFEGPLFIGGAPSKYLVGDLTKRNGFTGCFRGLIIEGHSIDLKSYLSPSMPTVINACRPSCTKNLCQNGGKCIEYWGSYECECSNQIAHSGSNCEINLNTNSITFVTPESHYVQISNDSSLYHSYLIKNILLNVRTYQETALILYASDHLNNFIQLHKNSSSLVLTFNSNNTIVTAQVPIDDVSNSDIIMSSPTTGIMQTNIFENSFPASVANGTQGSILGNVSNPSSPGKHPPSIYGGSTLIDRSIRISNTSGSGQPIQVKIERHRLRTTFYVNSNFMVVEKPISFLTNYTQNPWLNPELELVRPPRPKMGSKTYFQIFLANIDEYFSTRLPGFTGCIQGLSIDNQLFDFNRAHLTGELKGEYRIGCKMHCDSFPCKNQGTCIENWKEDRIQCKCDTTSYVGRLCDEDIAAIFNGHTSYFLYHLSKKFSTRQAVFSKPVVLHQNSTINSAAAHLNLSNLVLADIDESSQQDSTYSSQIDIGEMMNFFEISLAFSTDTSQSLNKQESLVQVLVLITRANSSKHFFLGLTPDGSLIVQEDYGNSMSLSRLIKRPEFPYNDGQRHMVKYTRYNQTIQISVDYQTYLPTMSVITANQISKYSRSSVLLVGTVGYKFSGTQLLQDLSSDSNYTNYCGCIANLVIKMDDILIEPLSEAFGQNLETIKINLTSSDKFESTPTRQDSNSAAKPTLDTLQPYGDDPSDKYSLRLMNLNDGQTSQLRTLNIINKLSGMEVIDGMETIVARDVEQGKCSSFKKFEIVNEKRSVNEPKFTPLLEPRPVYMDPPRIKTYNRGENKLSKTDSLYGFGAIFYCSVVILTLVSSTALIYAYILQTRYKSEKFRCETPFFHKRDEIGSDDTN